MTPIGRPRIEGDREDEILEATVGILLDQGYDRLTMDAVAKQARASKATLYRRWESKQQLVIDALIRAKDMPVIEPRDTGTLRGDLLATFCGHGGMVDSRVSVAMGSVITALSTDEEFATLFREHFVAPKAKVAEEIYRRAIERGEISADLDLDIVAPALAAVVLHRMFVLGEPPTEQIVERVVDHLILPAVTSGSPAAKSPSVKKSPKAPKTRKS